MKMTKCRAARDAIAKVIFEMRNDPDTDTIWCNLLENHVNALLEDIRCLTHWSSTEIPVIQTSEGG